MKNGFIFVWSDEEWEVSESKTKQDEVPVAIFTLPELAAERESWIKLGHEQAADRVDHEADNGDNSATLHMFLHELADEIHALSPAVPADEEIRHLDFLERGSFDLRCFNVPTGGDDYEIEWRVISHHMDAPRERVVSRGKTPADAIQRALIGGEG